MVKTIEFLTLNRAGADEEIAGHRADKREVQNQVKSKQKDHTLSDQGVEPFKISLRFRFGFKKFNF